MARRNSWRDRCRGFLFWLVLQKLRLLARLPRPLLAPVIGAARWLAGTIAKDPNAAGPLVELHEIVRDDARGSEALRRILIEARDSQLVSVAMGAWRHHRQVEPDPTAAYARVTTDDKRSRHSPASIALIGDTAEFAFLREAYRRHPDCRLLETGDADSFAGANGVEIVLDKPAAVAVAVEALARGVAVSAHLGQAATAEAWMMLRDAAARHGAPLRLMYSYFYYPPAQKVKALTATGFIGEPTTLRIRATLGGLGATRLLAPPFGEQPLRHPAFDHFPLLTFLAGPAASLTAYLHPMDPAHGGQGLVACRFAAPGRLGLLECAYAPEMFLRSDYFPHEVEIEYTGTDGFLRLRRGMTARTQEPPLIARVGKALHVFGVELGLEDEWGMVYDRAVSEMLDLIGGREVAHLEPDAVLSALRMRERVYDAAKAARPVSL